MSNEEKKVLLDVSNLKTYFTSGNGRHKSVVKAVDDVTFKILEGETFGLVESSAAARPPPGAPSSASIIPPAARSILTGRRFRKMKKDDLVRLTSKMQMIFQDPIASINPRMTIEEIVSEGLKVGGMKDRGERLEMVYDILDKVGLTKDHATRYPHEFSGGQRQRVGIARALVTNPSLVIADEPVSALDVSIQAQVINLFNRLKDEMGLTVLFIAHNLSVVKYFSDRIGVMYMGKLVEIADADDLYKNPIHPYTRSLLSAIPQPDPLFERKRVRITYDPSVHRYEEEQPRYYEILPNHMIYASPSEYEQYRRELEYRA